MDHQDPRSALGRYLGPLCANNGRSISLIANSGQLTGAQTRGLSSETALLAPTQAQKFGPDAAPAPDSKASMSEHQSQLGRWQLEPLRDEGVHNSCWGHCRTGELFIQLGAGLSNLGRHQRAVLNL